MSDCGCLYWGKQEYKREDNVQMQEVKKGKEVEEDTLSPLVAKHRPAGEKRKRITEVQKLEIKGGELKIPRTEKGTGSVYNRREKESLDERQQKKAEKGSPDEQQRKKTEKGSTVPEERKTRGKGSKHKKVRSPSVVAKDSKEDKAVAHGAKSTSKVRQLGAL
jgi:hypothetical protein